MTPAELIATVTDKQLEKHARAWARMSKLDWEDLYSEGLIARELAGRTWDPNRGELRTHIWSNVRSATLDAIRATYGRGRVKEGIRNCLQLLPHAPVIDHRDDPFEQVAVKLAIESGLAMCTPREREAAEMVLGEDMDLEKLAVSISRYCQLRGKFREHVRLGLEIA